MKRSLNLTASIKPITLVPCPITHHEMRRGGRFAAAPPPAEGGDA